MPQFCCSKITTSLFGLQLCMLCKCVAVPRKVKHLYINSGRFQRNVYSIVNNIPRTVFRPDILFQTSQKIHRNGRYTNQEHKQKRPHLKYKAHWNRIFSDRYSIQHSLTKAPLLFQAFRVDI